MLWEGVVALCWPRKETVVAWEEALVFRRDHPLPVLHNRPVRARKYPPVTRRAVSQRQSSWIHCNAKTQKGIEA